MNHQPNIIAESLVNRTTSSLDVIIPNQESTFFSSTLSGIQHVAAQYKSSVQIIRHLKSRGIKTPQTINVAGFGNEYTGEIVEPKLTTFDVKTRAIGEAAAKTLLEQIISKDKQAKTIMIKEELIKRESTKKKEAGQHVMITFITFSSSIPDSPAGPPGPALTSSYANPPASSTLSSAPWILRKRP